MERLLNFSTFRIVDFITTLTYVFMDNFYPCFYIVQTNKKNTGKYASLTKQKNKAWLISMNFLLYENRVIKQ